MPQFGRSIRIFLADGSPTGLRHVEIANWSGQALACPRSRFSELNDWHESKRPGVYFLFENAAGDENSVYVGESENVFKRLADHDRQKDFWNEVVIFTSKDENLTKGHIKYLEARLVSVARQAERYEIQNANAPTQSTLPRADEAAMEEFIDNIRIVLGSLGHRVLEMISPVAESNDEVKKDDSIGDYTLFFKTNGLTAKGRVVDDGFLLLSGSQLSNRSSKSLSEKNIAIKNQMLDDGVLQVESGHLLLVKDKLLRSSSSAADLVAGNSRSGPQSWKTEGNELLKSLEERLLSASISEFEST
ncbi:Methionine sulfoxide reductase [Vibrio crassostreae]|nr:Methionine sulfoxide reductase [Vibrio crassostreae]CAK2010808.1 Methionine sulfoxide reductase [Vibrio crassostreae]CAK2014383.1 Methionine sulfoxide reductase [Vibrio crassostreae]CAK2018035.1 Methionine sulfoxide reductase [Vibrio crassostreae]CAK2019509.1 Methionine sulfoxide reductase [Vibrio crassostreae]